VADSFNFNQVKKTLKSSVDSGKRRLSYLYDLISREGWDGVIHWFKSHNQIDQLSAAIDGDNS